MLNNCNFIQFKTAIPTNLIDSLKLAYANINFDYTKLNNELCVLYNSDIFVGKNVLEIERAVINHKMSSEFSEVHKLAMLILTLPSTTVEVERSFSALKRNKTYCRKTMGQHRLNGLALMAIEKELLKKNKIAGVVL